MARALALAAVLAGGCYRPTVTTCALSCGPGASCPDGLVCATTGNRCVVSAEEICDPITVEPDAPVAVIPDGSSPCAFPASNIDPCALGLDMPSLLLAIPAGTTTIMTGIVGASAPTLFGTTAKVVTVGFDEYVVFSFDQVTVAGGGTLQISGDRPLILLARTGLLDSGKIIVKPTTRVIAGCNAGPGASLAPGGGGGGGGFGTVGGLGGPLLGMNIDALGGMATGMASLEPLRGGCPGGLGGAGGGSGGAGGGALQISSMGTITINAGASIQAAGAGGFGASVSGGGGGGGGAGGAILLEATQIVVAPTAALCANGGAGGSTAVSAPGAVEGTCTTSPATAAPGMNLGGSGAAGTSPASAGGPSSTSLGAGGGGGGGGRIRINGTYQPTTAVVSPLPSTNP